MLKALKREAKLKKNYSKGISGNYLWFIGVLPENQGEGMGSHLLDYIKVKSQRENKHLYLETSSERNLSWYSINGFELYHQMDDFGFPFYYFRYLSYLIIRNDASNLKSFA